MIVKITDPLSKYYGKEFPAAGVTSGIYEVETSGGKFLYQATNLEKSQSKKMVVEKHCYHCDKPADCVDGWNFNSCWSCVYESPVTHLDHLYEKANELCMIHWSVPFTGKIRMSKRRWKYAYALYYPHKREITFNLWINHRLPQEKVYASLLHELVHWKLHADGKPYRDIDHYFTDECKRVGAPINE